MKKRCAGLAVVLMSLVAFGVGSAATPFRGVIDPNGHSIWVDSARVIFPSGTEIHITVGWGSDSVAVDTFDFPELSGWPAGIMLMGTLDGLPKNTTITTPESDTWYLIRGVRSRSRGEV